MPRSAKPREITVMRLGQQTDSNGVTRTFTAEEMDRAIAANNRISFQVPIILTHKSPDGVADHEVADHPKSLGIIGKFRRVGDAVKASVIRGTDKLFKWIDDGVITGRSASIYTPQSPSNPSPGNYFFRHLAMLSEDAPAIKGMPDMAEELGLSEALAAFAEDDESQLIELSFAESDSQPESAESDMTTVTRKDLDDLKADFMAKLEAAVKPPEPKVSDSAKPADHSDPDPEPEKPMTGKTAEKPTEKTENPTVDVTQYTEQIANLNEENAKLKAKVAELTPKPEPTPSAAELAFQEKTKQLAATLAYQEKATLKTEIGAHIASYAEQLTPALKLKQTVNYTERQYNADTAQFSEEPKTADFELAEFMSRVASGETGRADYEGFKHWLTQLPKQADLSGRSVMDHGEVEPAKPVPIDQVVAKANALYAERRAQGVNFSKSDALDEILQTENLG